MRDRSLLAEIRNMLGADTHPSSRALLAILEDHWDQLGRCATCVQPLEPGCHARNEPFPCPPVRIAAAELGILEAIVAADSLVIFVDDLRAAGGQPLTTVRRMDRDDRVGGPFGFDIIYDGISVPVQMPGLPVERLRYVPGRSEKAGEFERLYVNGGSWLWPFALKVCAEMGAGAKEVC
jgi:hypothetical protein